MDTSDVLIDAFGRIRGGVHRVLDRAGDTALVYRADPDANTIAWLVWHLTRIMDDHVADLAGTEQRWTADGWAERFGLPFDPHDTGFGHDSDRVGRVRVPPEMLAGYHDAVQDASAAYLEGVDADELQRIVDERWDPPVSAGVRLVSVIGDGMQHLGQASYVLGLAERAGV